MNDSTTNAPTRERLDIRSSLGPVYVICALTCCALLAVFTHTSLSTNPASRVATMDALVHDRSFIIRHSPFKWTIDKVMVGGRPYSSKPPTLSVAGAVVYKALHQGFGLSLRDPQQFGLTLYLLTWILAGLPYLLLLAYGAAFLRRIAPTPEAAGWAFACLGLGQLGLAYSTTINNHVPAAVAVFIAFYHAFGLRRGELHGRRHWIYVGLAGGLAPALDLGAVFFSGSIGLYLLSHDWRRALRWLAPAAMLPIAVHFGLTWWSIGSVLPAYLRGDLYDYEGSYWRHPLHNDALNEPRLQYAFNVLLGHHGLFSMTPVLLFSVTAMIRAALEPKGDYRREASAILGALVSMIVFYVFTTRNYGGSCAGFRWFLPAVPVALLFVSHWVATVRSRLAFGIFLCCMLIGQLQTMAALREPWDTAAWESWLRS